MEKNEKKLRVLINKTIKESFIEEIDFSKIKSGILNFFSKKPSSSSQTQNMTAPSASTTSGIQNQVGSIKKTSVTADDFFKIKYILIGTNKVSTKNIDFSFFYNLYEKVNGQIERKKINPVPFQWFFDKKSIFDVDKVFLKSNYNPKKPKKTDIVFEGIWKQGNFRGFFKSGIFEGGNFYGVYAGQSENFLPNKNYSEKIKAFNGLSWLSLDGLFGLKYIDVNAPPQELHMLQLQEGDYIVLKSGKNNIRKIIVLKQPFGEDLTYKFSVQKQNKATKKYFAPEIFDGNLIDIQNHPEKYYISPGKKRLFFHDTPITINSVVSAGKK
jgi:hypothetical protein